VHLLVNKRLWWSHSMLCTALLCTHW